MNFLILICFTYISLLKSFILRNKLISLLKGCSVIKLIAEKDIILLLISQFAYSITLASLAETVWKFVDFSRSAVFRMTYLLLSNMLVTGKTREHVF